MPVVSVKSSNKLVPPRVEIDEEDEALELLLVVVSESDSESVA
jgi:hypothetical protein